MEIRFDDHKLIKVCVCGSGTREKADFEACIVFPLLLPHSNCSNKKNRFSDYQASPFRINREIIQVHSFIQAHKVKRISLCSSLFLPSKQHILLNEATPPRPLILWMWQGQVINLMAYESMLKSIDECQLETV